MGTRVHPMQRSAQSPAGAGNETNNLDIVDTRISIKNQENQNLHSDITRETKLDSFNSWNSFWNSVLGTNQNYKKQYDLFLSILQDTCSKVGSVF